MALQARANPCAQAADERAEAEALAAEAAGESPARAAVRHSLRGCWVAPPPVVQPGWPSQVGGRWWGWWWW